MTLLNICSKPTPPCNTIVTTCSTSIYKYPYSNSHSHHSYQYYLNTSCFSSAFIPSNISHKFHTSVSSSSSVLNSFLVTANMPIHTANSGIVHLTRGSSWIEDNSSSRYSPRSNGCRPLNSAFASAPAVVSSVEDLYEFICSGPLMKKLGLTPDMVVDKINTWIEYGLKMCRLFNLNELNLNYSQKARIFHYYLPVFFWCENQISQHMTKFNDRQDASPLVIGFSAPQGCGKTTLVFALDYLFRVTGRNCATISIDDFYLTAKDQAKLREENPGNSLLEFRGNAGSHDLPFSVETLTALTKLNASGTKMKLPRYNKSAYGGKGDRADPSTWPEVKGPLKVILFEGWMLGFKPVPMEVAMSVDPQLEVVNKNLEAYYDAWDKFIDSWVVIKIKEPSCVYQWRLQAEVAMREDGKDGMSDEEVNDFVSRYLPAYRAYLPTLYGEGPLGSDKEHLLVVEVDEERNPITSI